MDEFLNPKASLTPGVLGAFMMLIANTISHFFPEIPFRFSALLLSFMIATLTFNASNITLSKKFILWILNALVIFTVGVGSTNIAANVEDSQYASLVSHVYAAEKPVKEQEDCNATKSHKKGIKEIFKPSDVYKPSTPNQFFKRW